MSKAIQITEEVYQEAIQEAIREGIITNIVKACPGLLNREVVALAEKILKDEDSQDVVIKVGEIREVIRGAADPEAYVADWIGVSWERSTSMFGQFKRAGYVATVPLIKEVKNV